MDDANFEVRLVEPDHHSDMGTFVVVLVNSADAMVGVTVPAHRYGVSAHGAVLIQVVPFDGLEWLTGITFKDLVADMEVSYRTTACGWRRARW